MRAASAIELDDAQRVKLAHSNAAEARLARRAGIVLLAASRRHHRARPTIGSGRGFTRSKLGR